MPESGFKEIDNEVPILKGLDASRQHMVNSEVVNAALNNGKILSVMEMAAIAKVSDDFIKLCLQAGYLNPSVHASTDVVPEGKQEAAAREANMNGIPFVPKLRIRKAEETFLDFWNSPSGRSRLTSPKCVNEMFNRAKGYPANYRSPLNDSVIQKIMADVGNAVDKAGYLDANIFLNATDGRTLGKLK